MKHVIFVAGTVLIAIFMAIVGGAVLGLWNSEHPLLTTEYCIPSVVLWVPLSFILRDEPLGKALFYGAISPFVGALWFTPFAAVFMFTIFYQTVPVGIVTGYLVWRWCGAKDVWRTRARDGSAPSRFRSTLLTCGKSASLSHNCGAFST